MAAAVPTCSAQVNCSSGGMSKHSAQSPFSWGKLDCSGKDGSPTPSDGTGGLHKHLPHDNSQNCSAIIHSRSHFPNATCSNRHKQSWPWFPFHYNKSDYQKNTCEKDTAMYMFDTQISTWTLPKTALPFPNNPSRNLKAAQQKYYDHERVLMNLQVTWHCVGHEISQKINDPWVENLGWILSTKKITSFSDFKANPVIKLYDKTAPSYTGYSWLVLQCDLLAVHLV